MSFALLIAFLYLQYFRWCRHSQELSFANGALCPFSQQQKLESHKQQNMRQLDKAALIDEELKDLKLRFELLGKR